MDGGDAEALPAGEEVLDVDVLAVGFPFALVFGLGGVGLVDSDEIVAVDLVAALGEFREIGFFEEREGAVEEWVKRRIGCRVLKMVEDHGWFVVCCLWFDEGALG